MSKSVFGHLPSGETVHQYMLKNAHGMQVHIINYGAIITGLFTPSERGERVNMVLGYDNLDGYLNGSSYLGAVVGRVANRIDRGRFTLGNQSYSLATNNGPNHLHGGEQGFDRKLWQVRDVNAQAIVLTLTSEHGDQGYPGQLEVQVTYSLRDDNTLAIDYRADCFKAPTPVNLTQHSYFNLGGDLSVEQGNDIGNHSLKLFCQQYTPINEVGIPTGEIKSVMGTAFDFSSPRILKETLDIPSTEIISAGGLDHNFVINSAEADLAKVAVLKDRLSGRSLEVFSSQPGVQVYTGNYLHVDGARPAYPLRRHGGICLECQSFPDAINHPNFPSIVIEPGEQYQETTCYKLGW